MTISGPLKTNSMSFLYRSRVSWRYFLGWHMDGLWGTRLTMKRPWSEPKKHSRTWWTGLLSMWSREGGVGPLQCLLVSNCSPHCHSAVWSIMSLEVNSTFCSLNWVDLLCSAMDFYYWIIANKEESTENYVSLTHCKLRHASAAHITEWQLLPAAADKDGEM